jgi:hypothetical protein
MTYWGMGRRTASEVGVGLRAVGVTAASELGAVSVEAGLGVGAGLLVGVSSASSVPLISGDALPAGGVG